MGGAARSWYAILTVNLVPLIPFENVFINLFFLSLLTLRSPYTSFILFLRNLPKAFINLLPPCWRWIASGFICRAPSISHAKLPTSIFTSKVLSNVNIKDLSETVLGHPDQSPAVGVRSGSVFGEPI